MVLQGRLRKGKGGFSGVRQGCPWWRVEIQFRLGTGHAAIATSLDAGTRRFRAIGAGHRGKWTRWGRRVWAFWGWFWESGYGGRDTKVGVGAGTGWLPDSGAKRKGSNLYPRG